MEEDSLDFGELSEDENFKQRINEFRKNVESASKMLKDFFTLYNYDELSAEDKVRLRGVDPNQHDIKQQLNRVREYMSRSKKLYEKKHIMPRIDQAATKRFLKSGLWVPKSNKLGSEEADPKEEVPAKRVKTDNVD